LTDSSQLGKITPSFAFIRKGRLSLIHCRNRGSRLNRRGIRESRMTRENVRRDELHEILNGELHRQDPCGECRFTQAPGPPGTPDESGCNWSQVLILRYGRSGNDSCAEVASRVITQVAARFNLKPSVRRAPEEEPPTERISSAVQGTMRSRETYFYFQIDTNRINSRGTLAAMNRLERWHRDGVIGLVMSDIAHAEAKAGRNARRSRKAIGYIYSLSFEREPNAQQMQAHIAEMLFPQGCRKQGDVNDVRKGRGSGLLILITILDKGGINGTGAAD